VLDPLYLLWKKGIGGVMVSMLTSRAVDLISGPVKPKTITLVFVASPLSKKTQIYLIRLDSVFKKNKWLNP
jgi:hypothetical protein